MSGSPRPPLRERREDLPLLARHFLRQHAQRYRKRITGFEAGATQGLLEHAWPGNVRELDHAVERAVLAKCGSSSTLSSRSCGRGRSSPSTRTSISSLEQALINLLRNGVDAAEETGGSVETGWTRLPGFPAAMEIGVEDEGRAAPAWAWSSAARSPRGTAAAWRFRTGRAHAGAAPVFACRSHRAPACSGCRGTRRADTRACASGLRALGRPSGRRSRRRSPASRTQHPHGGRGCTTPATRRAAPQQHGSVTLLAVASRDITQ
jgi:hypothetical protein